MANSKYHPDKNPGALPPIASVADLDLLPWGGNAWWDLPIMRHVDVVVFDTSLPKRLRRAISERAGFLMTGEDCRFKNMAEFDAYLPEFAV